MSGADKGFTLIELLISITIVAVILVIIMAALRIGVRAWESGEKHIETHQREQIVLSLMKQQMASMCWQKIQKEEGDPYFFSGNPHAIEFISRAALIPENTYGAVYVKYRIVPGNGRGKSLEIAEQPFAKRSPDKRLCEPDEAEFKKLIPEAEDMFFEFLVLSENGEAQWQQEAIADTPPGLPSAVRFTLKMTEKTPAVSIVARVTAEQDMLQKITRRRAQ